MLTRSIKFQVMILASVTLFAIGCTSNQPTIPNPFTTADRVPPPVLQAPAPGAAQPYYQGAQPAPAFQPGATTQPAPTYQPQITPIPGQPLSNNAKPRSNTVASAGESISIPSDQSALRFAAPNLPNHAPSKANLAVSQRQPATANSWVSGAAPIRTRPMQLANVSSRTQPTARVPSTRSLGRQPVNIAALTNESSTGQVQIRPLKTNSADETLGWR